MASRALIQTVDRAGVLCRVVRRGRHFNCGLCRNSYAVEIEALSCVERCWQETLCADPVLVRKLPAHVEYRCRFCARDHKSHALAVSCATECRAFRDDRLALLIEVIGMPLPPAPERKIKPRRALAPLLPLQPKVKKSAVPKVTADKVEVDGTLDPAYADVK